jgi:16S rRNA U516 pseudouridylate synthase RsuA-like enzyme
MWRTTGSSDADAESMKPNKTKKEEQTRAASTTTTTSSTIDGNSKITLKAAVQACWPNESIVDVIRLIKQGCIEVSSSSTEITNENSTTVWTLVRQHGKRIVYPNQYLRRRRRVEDDANHSNNNNNSDDGDDDDVGENCHFTYEIRMVPSYPIVIALYKPCGYIVTTGTATSNHNTTDQNVHDDSNEEETFESSPSTSVYDLLTTSTRCQSMDTDDALPYLTQLRAVGRLDKNTEGLLLFTNHGRWNIALTHPIATTMSSKEFSTTDTSTIWKRYRCVLQNPATLHDLQFWIRGGIPFRHVKSTNGRAYSQPALSATFVLPNDQASVHHRIWKNDTNTTSNGTNATNNHTSASSSNTSGTSTKDYHNRIVDVTIGEGKYRQVRRCWESLSNNKVLHLQRLSFGPIHLIPTMPSSDPNHHWPYPPLLQPGQWRSLMTTELQMLERYVHEWYRHNPNYAADSKAK